MRLRLHVPFECQVGSDFKNRSRDCLCQLKCSGLSREHEWLRIRGVEVRQVRATRQKHEWPRSGGTIEKNRSVRHSVKLSIGEPQTRVKLLEEISLPSPLKSNFSSTTGRMDPAGFEPASATVTECYVPLTLRALQ